jgi:hypothetical protein
VDTVIKIFYQTPDKPFFTEKHIIFQFVSKGKNDFYQRITEPALLQAIRFDPGETAGKFQLKKLEFATDHRGET